MQPDIVITGQVDERISQVIGGGLDRFDDAIAGYAIGDHSPWF